MQHAPRVLVCAATRAEHDACRRGILVSEASEASGAGRRHEHELLCTGVGPLHAARSLAERLARGVLPDLVISSGFAGALGPALALCSWITGVRVDEWNGATRARIGGVSLVEGPPGLVRCDVLSASGLVSAGIDAAGSPVLALLGDGAMPVAVDMESAALAREAGRRGVSFAVVRLISDTPAHPLPSFLSPFADAMSASGSSRIGHAARGLRGALANPRGVVQLMREGPAWLRRLEEGWRDLARWSGPAVRT